jgi:hypothetical protein
MLRAAATLLLACGGGADLATPLSDADLPRTSDAFGNRAVVLSSDPLCQRE